MSAAVAVIAAAASLLHFIGGNWEAGLGFLTAAMGWGMLAFEDGAR